VILGSAVETPYPGLRPFRRDETHLFFGREGCVNAMVDRLAATRFLAVLGSSGTGKSSLVRIGLLDALEIGLMAKAGSRWQVIEFRPRDAARRNLARCLLASEGKEEKAERSQPDEIDVDLLRARLERGPRSLIDWCRDVRWPDTNLLLLIDQFEELFLNQDYAGRQEAEAFAALLLESVRSEEVPIYVTLTMRSEYLGACALIDGLAEAVNAGMYLTPRMTREQCRQAIEGPARVCEIKIEGALVNRLLNDLANFAPWDETDTEVQLDSSTPRDQLTRIARRADQLPLLQYTLNRLWTIAKEKSIDPIELNLADYLDERVGGLRHALDRHANEILEKTLGKELQPLVERIFQRLTAGSTIAEAVRLKVRFGDLVALCEADEMLVKRVAPEPVEAAVHKVIDAFRDPNCNFLITDADPSKAVEPETLIEISHESIIRQWALLSEWLAKEAASAERWRMLNRRFSEFERDRAARRKEEEWLHGRELDNFVFWHEKMRPNEVWARRYHYGFDFDKVIGFLRESKHLALRHAQQKKRKKKIVWSVIALAFGVLWILLYLIFWMSNEANRSANEAREARLTANEAKQRVDEAKLQVSETNLKMDEANLREKEAEMKAKETYDYETGVTATVVFDIGQRLTNVEPELAERVATIVRDAAAKARAREPSSVDFNWDYAGSLESFGDVMIRIFDAVPARKECLSRAFEAYQECCNTWKRSLGFDQRDPKYSVGTGIKKTYLEKLTPCPLLSGLPFLLAMALR
jgi:hypothetical protein